MIAEPYLNDGGPVRVVYRRKFIVWSDWLQYHISTREEVRVS